MTQREPINPTPPAPTPLVNPAEMPASPLPRRVVRRRSSGNQGGLRPSRLNLVLTHLLLIVFSMLFAFPIYWIIRISLQSGSALLSVDFNLLPQNPTLDNYVRVFTNPVLGRAFLNSVVFAGGTTLVSLVLAISAAYAYSRMRFRGRKFSLWAMILLQAVPGIATIVPLYVLFVQFNLINTYSGLIIAYTAGTLPFSIWMMKSYFDTIPREIDEAAQVDGATLNQSFLRVILPLARPAIAIVALFGFITGWTEFVLAITFITSGELYPLSVRLYSIVGERTTEWGYFAAMSLVFAAPVVLFFLIFQRFLVGGLTLGSVKG